MAMMYIDEEEVWKCSKHPGKRRRTGICHVCLRERLSALCPDCANVRPCSCNVASTSSSVSSSSSFSFGLGIGIVGRVSNRIEREPSFHRSRSLAVPFLRSKPSVAHNSPKAASPFWSLFKSSSKRGSRSSNIGDVELNGAVLDREDEDRRRMMRKSRSVAVTVTSDSGGGDVKLLKGKGWYFPSPIKAFKQSISKGIMAQERSPLYRG